MQTVVFPPISKYEAYYILLLPALMFLICHFELITHTRKTAGINLLTKGRIHELCFRIVLLQTNEKKILISMLITKL
jgi:hypothetical protein